MSGDYLVPPKAVPPLNIPQSDSIVKLAIVDRCVCEYGRAACVARHLPDVT